MIAVVLLSRFLPLFVELSEPGLLHDGTDGKATPEKPTFVVYATECNPKTSLFEEWHQIKEESFGGSDGVEFIEAELIETVLDQENNYITLEVDEEIISIVN